MSYYPEPDSHIIDKVKVVLDFSNYATEKELDHATCIDASGKDEKKDFIALRAEVDKLDINEVNNVSTSLNNSKIKVGDLHICNLKTVAADLKKVSDVIEVKKKTLKTLKTLKNGEY